MKTSKIVSSVVALLLSVFAPLVALAQGVPPPNDSAPIDAAAGFLILGTAAYGYMKLKAAAKNSGNQNNFNHTK